jgi:hypothetical protein
MAPALTLSLKLNLVLIAKIYSSEIPYRLYELWRLDCYNILLSQIEKGQNLQTGVVVKAGQWREVYDPRIFIPLLAATVFCFVFILARAQNQTMVAAAHSSSANQQQKTSTSAVSGTPQVTIASPSSLPTISTNVSATDQATTNATNTFSPQPSGNLGAARLDQSGGHKTSTSTQPSSGQSSGLSDFQNFVFNIMNSGGNDIKSVINTRL